MMKQNYKLIIIQLTLTLSLVACSKTTTLKPVDNIKTQAQTQVKLSYKDCQELKGTLIDEEHQYTIEMLYGNLPEETQINQLPLPEEELVTAAMMPTHTSVNPGEKVEEYNKRMREETEAVIKIEKDKQAVLDANAAKIRADFEIKKSKLTAEIEACLDSLEQEKIRLQ